MHLWAASLYPFSLPPNRQKLQRKPRALAGLRKKLPDKRRATTVNSIPGGLDQVGKFQTPAATDFKGRQTHMLLRRAHEVGATIKAVRGSLGAVCLGSLALWSAAFLFVNGQAGAKAQSSPTSNAGCLTLADRIIGGGRIMSAEPVQPLNEPRSVVSTSLKANAPYCRVRALLHPVIGSTIHVEVWLPETWNGKMLGLGGGGYSGGLGSVERLREAANQGYAGLATDAGHKVSAGAKWAHGKPEQIVDWGYRANHVSAQFAKALIATHYGRPVRRTYFHGCSNGGRDALMEARRYPEDYDGIIAGAPAADWTGMTASFIWNWQAIFQAKGAENLPLKIPAVSSAIRAKCDMNDGVQDGVLENPHSCPFDPAELQCRAGNQADCLTAPEVDALRKIYVGPRLKNAKRVFAGFPVGDEDIPLNAGGWLAKGPEGTGAFGAEFFRWMVYQDPKWKMENFVLDRDYPNALGRMGPIVDSHDPDLRGLVRRGAKLIIYHGWSDARIQADATLMYYNAVRRRIGGAATQRHVRLFMVPGMAHCTGGPGPDEFDMLSHLDAWVERGTAPDRVVASKYQSGSGGHSEKVRKLIRTRPLCAWPKTAQYRGTGSTDDEANFVCRR